MELLDARSQKIGTKSEPSIAMRTIEGDPTGQIQQAEKLFNVPFHGPLASISTVDLLLLQWLSRLRQSAAAANAPTFPPRRR